MSDKRFIKKLDEYFKMLSEAFDNPLNIKWIDEGNKLIGLFYVYENVYQINCNKKNNDIWKYDFYLYEDSTNSLSPEITGFKKDKYRVLPTIKSGLEYLIKNKNVNAIIFGATDKSKGRKKLYESFCVDFARNNNFEYYTKLQDDKQIFVLYKSNINKNVLMDTIIKTIEEEKP